ncbi:MAG: ABC transporter permease [Acuticoccus sp.]
MSGARAPLLLSAPALVLYGVFLVVPLASVLILSFNSFDFYEGIQPTFSLANYIDIFTDSYFVEIYARTFAVALAVTVACVVLGTTEAYILNRMRNPWKSVFLVVILGPLLVSTVVRTIGWAFLFGANGAISTGLQAVGLASGPVNLMYTNLGVIIALTHVFVPFVVISVWASLQKMNAQTEAAAYSLGASQGQVVRHVVLPQIVPGMLSGAILVFALSASAFATPSIIGGRRLKNVSMAAYDEFLNSLDWPLGAAMAVLLLIAMATVLITSNRLVEHRYRAVFQRTA